MSTRPVLKKTVSAAAGVAPKRPNNASGVASFPYENIGSSFGLRLRAGPGTAKLTIKKTVIVVTEPNASSLTSKPNPDGKMATASRPGTPGKFEIESADDFALTSETSLTSATFTGLLPTGSALSNIKDVDVEIYGVFPVNSNVGRTSGSPTFQGPFNAVFSIAGTVVPEISTWAMLTLGFAALGFAGYRGSRRSAGVAEE
jgi:hypothetical protein